MMTASRAAAASPAGRKIVTGLCVAALLPALAACAGGNATSSLATPATTSASPAPATPTTAAAAAPAQPAPAAAAPAAPPQHLTKTEINEKCWMRTEPFHADNLDKRMKLVDKCIDEMTRAQGGV
jgi:hypothetical protein